VVGGGVWKAYAAVSYELGTEELFMVVREGEDVRLRVYLSFLGDKADLFAPANRQFGDRNRRIMASVARFIRKYPGYRIVVEGHTNRAKLDMSFDEEQRKEMLPLARARAAAVKDALVGMGFDAKRLSTVAYGGLKPLAKFEDSANTWKNRRVEILLVKEEAKAEGAR
jgi:flagellar motor protein MotB